MIEILTQPSGITFDECWGARAIIELEGIPVDVVGLEHLRRNKRASGRLKDLADLEELPPAPDAS